MLEQGDPSSADPRIANRKDGARELVKLLFQSYLPMRENVQLWATDPESFIDVEDESYFISEYDLDAGCSMNLLAYQVLEKLFGCFYHTCYTYVNKELIP